MQRHRNDMRHREALQRRYLGDPKYDRRRVRQIYQ